MKWSDVRNGRGALLSRWMEYIRPDQVEDCYTFQKKYAFAHGTPVLNVCCGLDTADLGRLGAVNVDRSVPPRHLDNFIEGSIFELEKAIGDEKFACVVLGEFLEHCSVLAAIDAMEAIHKALKPDGHVVITLPLDGRPIREQRVLDEDDSPPPKSNENHGVTTHHQAWWSNAALEELCYGGGFEEIKRTWLFYVDLVRTAPIGGWGMVWRKKA